MNEILGSTGTSSPINPIRKKELDNNWKAVAAKAITDEVFKKILVADPLIVLAEYGLKMDPEIKVRYDETNKEHNVIASAKASEEVQAETQWWAWRLKMIKEFGQELDRQVGTVAGYDAGCGND